MRRIAVPVNQGRVKMSLEKGDMFRVYETEGNHIVAIKQSQEEQGILSLLLKERAEAVICGMVSDGLRRDLAMHGIVLFAGIYGDADEVVEQLLNNTLACIPDTMRRSYAAHYSPCSHNHEY